MCAMGCLSRLCYVAVMSVYLLERGGEKHVDEKGL